MLPKALAAYWHDHAPRALVTRDRPQTLVQVSIPEHGPGMDKSVGLTKIQKTDLAMLGTGLPLRPRAAPTSPSSKVAQRVTSSLL